MNSNYEYCIDGQNYVVKSLKKSREMRLYLRDFQKV